jgi:hypothetical protein
MAIRVGGGTNADAPWRYQNAMGYGARESACVPAAVSQIAGSFRYLRILVTLRRAIGCELLGAIGRELQHAVEVLQDPKIVDFNTLFHFYLRTAPTTGEAFETEAARRAGLRVRAEVIAGKKCK